MPRHGQDPRRRVRKEPRRPSLGAGVWRRSRALGARGPRVSAFGRGSSCPGRVARVFRREVLLEGLLYLFSLVGGPPVIPRPVVAPSRVTGPQQQLAGHCWDGPIFRLLLDLHIPRRRDCPDVGRGGHRWCLRRESSLLGLHLTIPRGGCPGRSADPHLLLMSPAA